MVEGPANPQRFVDFCDSTKPLRNVTAESLLNQKELHLEQLTLCKREMISAFPSTLPSVNQESKSSDDENMSGRRKFSNAHSSCRLF